MSTDEQGDNGVSLAAQEQAIRAEAARRGWEVDSVVPDPGASGKSLNRLGLQVALAKLKAGQVQALICSNLDRLTRSVADFNELRALAAVEGWALVMLDARIDTSTAEGEMIALSIANFAQFERRKASERTKAALARRKAEGAQLGRPRTLPGATVAQIKNLRGDPDAPKRSYGAIAKHLNAKGVPTAHGGERWHASTVRAVLQR